MAQISSSVPGDIAPENNLKLSGNNYAHQDTEVEEEVTGNTERQDQFWKIFQSSKSYWDSYIRTSAWLNQHCNVLQESQRTGSRYEQWCRSQMSYHAVMANFFYSQWLKSQSSADKDAMGDPCASSKLEIPLQNSSVGRCADARRYDSKKRSRTRKSSKRNRSRRNKRKSSCHIKLHLGDDDPGSSQLDIFFDGTENTEFEMEITDEMLQFFNQSAKHREERGWTFILLNVAMHCIELYTITV